MLHPKSSANMGLHCPCSKFQEHSQLSGQRHRATKCSLIPLQPFLIFYSTGSEFKARDLLLPSSEQVEFADYGSVMGGRLVQHSNTSLCLVTRMGNEAMHRENGNSAPPQRCNSLQRGFPCNGCPFWRKLRAWLWPLKTQALRGRKQVSWWQLVPAGSGDAEIPRAAGSGRATSRMNRRCLV